MSKFAPSKGDLELESVEDKVALEPPSSTPPELTFPDGGLRAWLIVVAVRALEHKERWHS